MRKYKSLSGDIRIIDNFKRPARHRPPLPLPPTTDEFEQTEARIKEAEILYDCLVKDGVNVWHLSNIITYIKHDERAWEAVWRSRVRQIKRLVDRIKKTKVRHPEPAKERESKQLKMRKRSFGILIRRGAIEDDPLYRSRLSGTKHRPYLDTKIPLLKALLSETGRPFYYMAALFALFRLMPQGSVCKRCPKLPRCGPASILDCISLDTFRISLSNIAAKTPEKSRLPDNFLVRIKKDDM
ncbi:MAG: hypothetical protein AB1442_11660 [Nitrospirota bacterium]